MQMKVVKLNIGAANYIGKKISAPEKQDQNLIQPKPLNKHPHFS